MTYFLLRDYNLLPKKELHWSPSASYIYTSHGLLSHSPHGWRLDVVEGWPGELRVLRNFVPVGFTWLLVGDLVGKPRCPLKGSFKGDIDI